MAKNAEALAAFYRVNGWDAAARVLEADAGMFRQAGMPEQFSEQAPEIKYTGKPTEGKNAIMSNPLKVKLVEILYGLSKAEPTLASINQSPELAQTINQEIGQHLPDDIVLSSLIVPGHEHYGMFGKEFEDMGAFEISPNIIGSFTRVISALDRSKLITVGAVRAHSPYELRHLEQISDERAYFISEALKPPSPSTEQIQ